MARANRTGIRGLYKTADGRYRLDFRWKVGAVTKRWGTKLPPGTTGAAARKRAQDVLAQIVAGTFDPDKPAPATLREALDAYLAWCDAHGLRSVRSRRSHAKAWCAFLGESRAVEELAAFDLERFKGDAKKRGRAAATINRHLATIKHFARWAARVGHLEPATAATLRSVPLLREPPGRVRFLAPDEERRLLEALDAKLGTLEDELRPVVLAALLSGMRRSELVGLRWSAVDLGRRTLTLTRTKSNRVRRVPVNDALAALLETLPGPRTPDAYAFPLALSERREGMRSTDEERRGDRVGRAFAELAADAKVSDFRFHDLRHDFATRVRRAGHGLDVVQKLLGHSTLAMASRYAHLEDPALHAAVAAITSPGSQQPLAARRPLSRGAPRSSGRRAHSSPR